MKENKELNSNVREVIYDEENVNNDTEKVIYDENQNDGVISTHANTTVNAEQPSPKAEDAIDRIRADKNDVMRMGFDANDLPNYCCPVCGSQRKSISALTHKKRFKSDEETVAFVTLCINCGNINLYGLDIPDVIEYLQTKHRRKRGK